MTLDSLLELLRNQHSEAMPFVVYRKPGEDKVLSLLQEDDELHEVLDHQEQGFIFAPFDHSKRGILLPLDHSRSYEASFENDGSAVELNDKAALSISDKEAHLSLVARGIETIASGPLQKVVLSRQEKVEGISESHWTIFKRMLWLYRSAFVYMWYHPKIGLWLGATPETLLRIKGRNLETVSLAGTMTTENADLDAWGKKEMEEQQMVTDFILDGLHPFTDGIKVSETQTVKAGHVYHLKTIIRARLKVGFKEYGALIRKLHPTPAVCGLPRNEAQDFIKEHEFHDRQYYTGYLGELNYEGFRGHERIRRNIENQVYRSTQDSTELFVNLRCMKLQDEMAVVYVGGGITQYSDPEDEWQETVNKAFTMKKVL